MADAGHGRRRGAATATQGRAGVMTRAPRVRAYIPALSWHRQLSWNGSRLHTGARPATCTTGRSVAHAVRCTVSVSPSGVELTAPASGREQGQAQKGLAAAWPGLWMRSDLGQDGYGTSGGTSGPPWGEALSCEDIQITMAACMCDQSS